MKIITVGSRGEVEKNNTQRLLNKGVIWKLYNIIRRFWLCI